MLRLLRRYLKFASQSNSGIIAFAIAVTAGLVLAPNSPARWIDVIWSDLLLANQRLEADSRIIIVNISADDLRQHGGDRLNRGFVADSLSIMEQAECRRVVIDFNCGSNLLPEEERALVDVCSRLGPDRLAFGYERDSERQPPQSVLELGTVVDLRMRADSDGRFRQLLVPTQDPALNAAAWLASGQLVHGATSFDLRVDPNAFPQIPVSQIHEVDFDRSLLKDKLIVFSCDNSIARSMANLPVLGTTNRGVVVAMATHALLHNFDGLLQVQRIFLFVLLSTSLVVAYSTGSLARSVFAVACGYLGVVSVVLGASLAATMIFGMRTEPASTLVASIVVLQVALAHRLRLLEIFAGFLAGDLSPEEVWLWRTRGDQESPVILFDGNGRIKRANPSAITVFHLELDSQNPAVTALARLCMPDFGVRANRLEQSQYGPQTWNLEWPHPSLPLVVFRDITADYIEHQSLRKQLITDPLTGTLNRQGFEESLQLLDETGVREYAIVFMDMNGFKAVNDTYGHEAGDKLLKVAAERFSKVLRKDDCVARLGGDEFAVILKGELSAEVTERICLQLEASLKGPVDIGSTQVNVGVAAGFALPQFPGETTKEVLHRADEAMYARKAWLKSKMQHATLQRVG